MSRIDKLNQLTNAQVEDTCGVPMMGDLNAIKLTAMSDIIAYVCIHTSCDYCPYSAAKLEPTKVNLES
ncbi:hypothetical protein NVP1238A_81 [Vibrio phage 1.238.A._10N.261.52.F10]|uniref:Uncharacterized protein n=1 Tax=Vibrio phage 1.238.A._10N.261.52.F10 TaxID=1881231 RepID=A0A2I7RUJ8_9CAUD|nr:hypothetical protein KNT79_gp81 [Vibrio phage 1.238.A._10N.261.52.F10]AUR97330.1 hypothetical protein NVP1238A_81 [Vibrio phage 1.238.A._10N.261.52.F10]AUR97424.1 hypothetical protein NVP1238B_82 [Vibrio phage 1.238.B._10N.261.52.F10]